MRKLFFFLLLIVPYLCGYGQDGVTIYPDPDGYSFGQLEFKSGLEIDASNNKWVAYASIGLGKFDGTAWTMYDTSNSTLPSDKMTCLFVYNNDIYAGTKKGLAKFDGNSSWTLYDTANGLLNNHVNAVNYGNGKLWVGTNKGLAIYNGQYWQYYYSLNSGLVNDTITSIEFADNNTVWIGTIRGLSCLYNNFFTNYDSLNSGLKSSHIHCLKNDINNNLWIGTKAGAYRMSNNVFKPLTAICNIPQKNDSIEVWSITTNIHNEVLIPGLLNYAAPQFGPSDQFIIKVNPSDDSYLAYYMNYIFLLAGYYQFRPYYICSDMNNILWSVGSAPGKVIKLKSLNFNEGTMYDAYDFLSANNIKARFNAGGQLFWDFNGTPTFEVPKGSGRNTLFSGTLWVGGKDANGQLHVAGELYHGKGFDYFPGPVMDSAFYSQESEKWNRVWRIKKSDIDNHMAHCFDPGYIPSQALINWPGNGDTALGQAPILAPFKDWNNDGIYDPFAGDFPLIKGDETVLFIFNDDRKPHTESEGNKLRIEVHAMAYSFDCNADSALWNTVFLNYKIFNRSASTYDSSFIGLYIDVALGGPDDDFIASDVTRGAFYAYNGDSIDQGYVNPLGYGANPPAQSIVFLSGAKMDDDGTDNPAGLCDEGLNGFNFGNGITDDEHHGMSGFIIPNGIGGFGSLTIPDTAADYYNYLRGFWKDGVHLKYWGNGHPSAGATGPACNFMFPGDSDPCDWGTDGVAVAHPPYWNETQAGNIPYDRRGIGSTGPFTFTPAEIQEIDVAFVYGRDFTDPDELAAITVMNQRIDSIRSYFRKDHTPCGSSISGIDDRHKQHLQFNIYPNPANDYITVETNIRSEIEIINFQGQLIKRIYANGDKTNIDISDLSRGMYFVKLQTEKKIGVLKFIKQ